MSDAAQQAAEDGVRSIASAIGVKDVSAAQVTAIAGVVLGLVKLGTGATWKGVEAEAKAAADAIATDAQAAEVLGR